MDSRAMKDWRASTRMFRRLRWETMDDPKMNFSRFADRMGADSGPRRKALHLVVQAWTYNADALREPIMTRGDAAILLRRQANAIYKSARDDGYGFACCCRGRALKECLEHYATGNRLMEFGHHE